MISWRVSTTNEVAVLDCHGLRKRQLVVRGSPNGPRCTTPRVICHDPLSRHAANAREHSGVVETENILRSYNEFRGFRHSL